MSSEVNYDQIGRQPPEKAGPVSRVKRIKELEAENKELREALLKADEQGDAQTLDDWMLLPQDMRDRLASRALVNEWGRYWHALLRLGFRTTKMTKADKHALREAVFDTPGCIAIREASLSDIEARRKQIIARQAEIAIHGDDEQATRSATFVARTADWIRENPAATVNVNLTLADLLPQRAGNPEKNVTRIDSNDPLILLAHEPGAPARIDSGSEAVESALIELDEA